MIVGTPATATGTINAATAGNSIYVLDPTVSGALTLSGNASINTTTGNVVVDSSSASAISASGNAQVTAATVQVVGGINNSGNAKVTKTGTPGATGDPFSSLVQPAVPSYSPTGAENLGGNSTATISQGSYSTINVSGNAHLTLSPGTYVIGTGGVIVSGNAVLNLGSGGVTLILEGGGFTVSGNASISGSNVFIFNGGSSYNGTTDGGTYGAIAMSGNGSFNLNGLLIFQDRSNSKGLAFSGNSMAGMVGTIYAPDAALTISGNASIKDELVIKTLNISGNAIANALGAPPAGSVAYTPDQVRTAYGINDLSYDGTGQTIALVEAYDDPNILQAVDAFDNQFGATTGGPTLFDQYGAASTFVTVLGQDGTTADLPAVDPTGGWETEEELDVEWAHAMAPGRRLSSWRRTASRWRT